MEIEKEIKALAHSLGLEAGISKIEPVSLPEEILLERMQHLLDCPFEPKAFAKRIDPVQVLPAARTMLSFFWPYPSQREPFFIARFARGEDYHQLLKGKLEIIYHFLVSHFPALAGRIYVDTGPIVERFWAAKAGLGWIGKNMMLLHKNFGSGGLLGEIVLNEELEPDLPQDNLCGSCEICLESCPAGALKKGGVFNYRRCLSYWTQAKGHFPYFLREAMGEIIYGCDRCQEKCPYNRWPKEEDEKGWPQIAYLLQLSNREFENYFQHTTVSWVKLETIQRNCLLALGNSGVREAVDVILPFMQHKSPILRAHATWSLKKLGGPKAQKALKELSFYENNSYVIGELTLKN